MFKKKIPAIFVTVALVLTSVLSVTVMANAASSFSPRYSAPSYDNGYYYSSKNIFYSAGYGMPNCTAYAFGRAYELLGTEPKLSHGNAQNWYGYNKNGGYYSYGSTPKLGAIACWSYAGGGHVAVVESIENGTITMSNSAWSGTNFYLSYASTSDYNAGGNSWWTFQGYIYILDSVSYDDNNNDDVIVDLPDTSNYGTGTYQVNINSGTRLNMRSGAGTSNSVVTDIPNGTKLNVTDIAASGNYVWGFTSYNGYNGWVALDYCDFISSSNDSIGAEPETTEPADNDVNYEEPTQEPTEEPTEEPTQESTEEPTENVTQEVTKAVNEPVTEETTATEAATEPTSSDEYVLYFADAKSENIVAYPLSSINQIAEVQLSSGEYNIYMMKNGELCSSSYPLALDTLSNVSVEFDEEKDYFLVKYVELANDAEEEPTEAETTAPSTVPTTNPTVNNSNVSTTSTVSTEISTASTNATSATSNSSVSTADTAAKTAASNGSAVQTGQNIYLEGMLLLTLSLTSLVLFWIKRRKYND